MTVCTRKVDLQLPNKHDNGGGEEARAWRSVLNMNFGSQFLIFSKNVVKMNLAFIPPENASGSEQHLVQKRCPELNSEYDNSVGL